MGNLLKDGLDYVKMTAWDQPTGILKDVGKGDIGGAFGKWKHTFGDNNDGEEKLLGDVGIRGWVGRHPTESAGAVVGSIFGGIYAAGAYGATAAAGSGAAAGAGGGAAATGSSALGGIGAGAYMAPAASGGVATTGSGAGLASSGALSAASANAPSTMALINMGNAGVGASGATAGASGFTPAMLTTQGAAASGGTYGAASAPAATLSVPAASASTYSPSSLGAVESVKGASSGMNAGDWNNIARLMNSIKQPEQQQQQLSPAPGGRAPGGSFNFDRKAFQNQALTKTYSDLYNNPTRAANIKF